MTPSHPTDETEQRLNLEFVHFCDRRIAEDLDDFDYYRAGYEHAQSELARLKDTALKTEMGLRSSRETIEAKYAQTVRKIARLQAENEALKHRLDITTHPEQ